MKLYQKIAWGLSALPLVIGMYFYNKEQPVTQTNNPISQSQTLESKLQNPRNSYNITKEQKDTLGYLTKLSQYKGEEKQEYKEPIVIGVKGSELKDIRKAAAENCKGSCVIYMDGDDNYRMAEDAGAIYLDSDCVGNFKGPGWLLHDQYGDISYGTNNSDKSNTEAHELIEWDKCD